jgi:hypothetical protein
LNDHLPAGQGSVAAAQIPTAVVAVATTVAVINEQPFL